MVTGDSQWEYPSDKTGTDDKKDTTTLETPIQSSAATVTSNQSLAAWSYSGEETYLKKVDDTP